MPILVKISSLKFNSDFSVGYSPERINPGDKEHTLKNIKKVTSGSNNKAAKKIDNIYKSIISAGTYLAPSIKVAEAAKVIENSQRDINIAFINELSKIFNLMNIDTNEVLEAASTKWNFLNFKPGLVGGHCIGVDPYYLAKKSISLGYYPEIILSGRKINDSMGIYVATDVISKMKQKKIDYKHSNCLILGITFKENCPDIRNSKVFDIVDELSRNKINVSLFDPIADQQSIDIKYSRMIIDKLHNKKFESVIVAVKHDIFKKIDYNSLLQLNSVIYDIKGFLDFETDGSL